MTRAKRPVFGRTARGLTVVASLSALLPACGGPEGPDGVSERTDDILGGTLTSDPAGYAFLKNLQAMCSGTFLTRQWVLTAGHCLKDNDGHLFNDPPNVVVNLGNSTGTGQFIGEQVFINPQWFDPSLPPAQQFPKDASLDVALLRMGTPFSTLGYPNFLVNELSNAAVSPGQTLTCFGYGETSTAGTGGGRGQLQKASLAVVDPAARLPNFALAVDGEKQTADMISLAQNAQGQQLYFGDSGGSCSPEGVTPNQIVGINAIVDAATPPTSYLVKAQAVHGWVDATMHSAPLSLGLPQAGPPPTFISAISSPSQNGNSIFVIAGYGGSTRKLFMKVFTANGGWSAWSALSVNGLPGSGINSRVALSATSFSPGTVQLVLAVIGGDRQMYVAPLAPGFGPSPSWLSMTWAPSNGIFTAGTQPAIVYTGSRVDVFGIGQDSKIYSRWKTDINSTNWLSSWNQVPTNMTFAKGVSVAFTQGSYFIVGLSDGTATVQNTGRAAWILSLTGVTATNFGTWTGVTPLGGGFSGPPAVTEWLGGMAIYGLGLNNNLFRASHHWTDPLSVWSTWNNMNKGTFNQPEGVSANTSWEQASEIDIVTADTSSNPVMIKFPF